MVEFSDKDEEQALLESVFFVKLFFLLLADDCKRSQDDLLFCQSFSQLSGEIPVANHQLHFI